MTTKIMALVYFKFMRRFSFGRIMNLLKVMCCKMIIFVYSAISFLQYTCDHECNIAPQRNVTMGILDWSIQLLLQTVLNDFTVAHEFLALGPCSVQEFCYWLNKDAFTSN